MVSPTTFLLFFSAALAAVIPRDQVPDGHCCFTLNDISTGKAVQQDRNSGMTFLSADQKRGWYCMEPTDKRDVLWDDLWNACIIDWAGRLQCLDGTLGPNSWTLRSSNKKIMLSHDGSQSYKACPNPFGKGEIIQSANKGNSAGCRSVTLAAQGMRGTCQKYLS